MISTWRCESGLLVARLSRCTLTNLILLLLSFSLVPTAVATEIWTKMSQHSASLPNQLRNATLHRRPSAIGADLAISVTVMKDYVPNAAVSTLDSVGSRQPAEGGHPQQRARDS
jgi:hypothetical protein